MFGEAPEISYLAEPLKWVFPEIVNSCYSGVTRDTILVKAEPSDCSRAPDFLLTSKPDSVKRI